MESPQPEKPRNFVADICARDWWKLTSAVTVGLLLALAVRYVFIQTLGVLSLFLLGLLLAYIADPVLDRLERRGFSRRVAAYMVTAGFLVLLIGGGAMLIPRLVYQVQDVARNWQAYSLKAQESYDDMRGQFEIYAQERFPDVEVMPFLDDKVAQSSAWLQDNLPRFLQWISQQLITSVGLLVLGFMLVVITFHFMMVLDPFKRTIREMLPHSADAEVHRVSKEINRMLGQYLRGMIVVSLSVGVTSFFVLSLLGSIFGTKYGLVIAVVAGVTYMVPYLGATLTAVLAAFFGYVTTTYEVAWVPSLVALVTMLVTNQIFDTLVTPRIVGRRVGLHPLVVLLAVMSGFYLLGVWGMIIATPVAASIKIILARWLPTKGPGLDVRAPRERLDIDLLGVVRTVGSNLAAFGRDIELALSGGPPPAKDTQNGKDTRNNKDKSETGDKHDDAGD